MHFSPVCIVNFVDFLLCILNTQQSAVLIIVSQEYRKPEKPEELHPGAKKSEKDVPTPTQASADSEKYDYKNHPRYVSRRACTARVTVYSFPICVIDNLQNGATRHKTSYTKGLSVTMASRHFF